MPTGAHVIVYSQDATADREFFKEVLELRHVDAGHGWLIFTLPPAEVAVHATLISSSRLTRGRTLIDLGSFWQVRFRRKDHDAIFNFSSEAHIPSIPFNQRCRERAFP